MKKIWIFTLLSIFLLTSCVTVADNSTPDAAPLFVTSTLPPTKSGLSLPTDTPTGTPDTATTAAQTPGTPDGTAGTVSDTASCKDSAVLLEDVTVPDNAQMQYSQKFTKTWRFKNTGTDRWLIRATIHQRTYARQSIRRAINKRLGRTRR